MGFSRRESIEMAEVRIDIPDAPQQVPPNERTILLTGQPHPPRFSKLRALCRRGAAATWAQAISTKDSVVDAIKHPIPTILGLTTSVQSLINAFANPSGVEPKDISVRWWNTLSLGTKIQSLLSLYFALWVNYPVNKRFIGDAFEKIKTQGKDMFKSVGGFFKNFSFFNVGLGNGLSMAVIVFEACLWIGNQVIVPAAFAALGFVFASASRYLGINMVYNLFKTLISTMTRKQLKSIDALQHLKMDYLLELNHVQESIHDILQRIIDRKANAILTNKSELSEEDYNILFRELITQLAEIERLHPENIAKKFYNPKQTKEYIAAYARILAKIVSAIVFGVTGGAVYMQKGFDAINIASIGLAGVDLNKINLNNWAKRGMGSLAFIGSGGLYGASAAIFTDFMLVKLPYFLYRHPKHIFSALFLFVANYYSAGSMKSVTANVVKRDNNILGFLSQGLMKKILPYLVHGGCLTVNILAKLKLYVEAPADPNHPSVENLIQRFEDPADHLLDPDSAIICELANNSLAFFQRKRPPEELEVDLEAQKKPDHIALKILSL